MSRIVREYVVIKEGGIIEIRCADLPVGATAEVTVLVEDGAAEGGSLESMVGKGKGCFGSAAEIDAFLRAERDAWER